MSAAITAKGLVQAYGSGPRILDDVSLEVAEGELVALGGPNGSGKSTLLRTLLGMTPPKSGEVKLGGDVVGTMARAAIARRAAFVPQGASTDFELSVREIVAMGRTPHLGRFRLPGSADHEAIEAALEATGMVALADRPFPHLSGGERQRAVLARAFAQGAKVLVLDEPTASLDLAHAYTLMTLVRRHVDAGGSAIVAIHDLALAARFADRLLLLSDAKIVADGQPRAVLTPRTMREVFAVDAVVLTDGDELALSVRGPADQ